jgi:hypothetical protein
MKKIIITTLAFFLAFSFVAHAGATASQNNFYYVFHLFQNNSGQLVADRDFKFSYDIIPGIFTQPAVGQFPYRGEIINLGGQVVGQFKFDVHLGKLSIQVPYVADGQRAVFYDNQNQPVLTISVSDSSFCNDDGICNADRGEDYLTCPNDCKAVTLPAPVATVPTVTATGSGGIVSGIIYAVIGLLLIGLAWWFLKRRRGPTSLTPPSAPLPTPPPPPSPNKPL